MLGAARRALPDVVCPILILHSRRDPTIHPRSAQVVYDGVRSADKRLIELHDSGHVITLDSEWGQVAEESYRWRSRRSTPASPSSSHSNANRGVYRHGDSNGCCNAHELAIGNAHRSDSIPYTHRDVHTRESTFAA